MGDDGSRSSNCGRQSSVAGCGRFGHEGGRIALAPPADLDRKFAAAHPLDRIDHLEHRCPAAIAAVEGRAGAAAAQIGECRRMGACEIANMDVVADAAASGSGSLPNTSIFGRLPSAASQATLIRCVAAGVDWPVRCFGSAPATLK